MIFQKILPSILSVKVVSLILFLFTLNMLASFALSKIIHKLVLL